MKKLLLGILCAGLSVSCAGRKNLVSVTEVSTPIVIDGEITDWMIDQENPIPFLVKDNIRYGFTTDSDYLYVVVEAKQQMDVMKMAGMGFTMWFNEDGKKKKTRGIRYPIGTMGDEMQPGGMGGGFGNGGMGGGMGMDPSMMYDLLSQDMDVLELIGFYSDEEMYIEVAEEDFGIKVKASFTEDGLFINEFAIPKKLILTKEKSDKLTVGFFTDEMERPSFGGSGPGGMGGGMGGGMQPPSGGMGGMGGGMRPGGGGMGGRSGMQEMMEPIEIWTTLDVAGN